MHDRDDALRLAQAVYRKQQLEPKPNHRFPSLRELLKREHKADVTFASPDVTYLVQRLPFKPRFIGQMIRRFGEAVVLEALRRVADYEFDREGYFVGVCRNIEKELADGTD